MLTMSHSLARTVQLPGSPERCHAILSDFMSQVATLSEVHSVEAYPNDIYRIILNKMGGRVGALSYGIHVAYDLEFKVLDDGIEARSLPRDPHDSWIGDGILLADYYSRTRFEPDGDQLKIDYQLEVRVDLPIPPILTFAPRGIMQTLGDGLMKQKATSLSEEMMAMLARALKA